MRLLSIRSVGEQVGTPQLVDSNASRVRNEVLTFEPPTDGYYLATVRTAFANDVGDRGVRDDSLRLRIESGIVHVVDREEYEELSGEAVAQKL